jgi:tetratricopeptide (TPR) repeat protein
MAIDFGKISPLRNLKRPIDPIELFQSLKVKDPAINDLWLAQGDALREWNAARTKSDVAIVLNTGAGKTLVGLLAAQSLVNETTGHVVYACSSIQLVEQTAAKAKGYGLDVTTYFHGNFSNDLYQSGRATCITTYHALFNGKSRFFRDSLSAVVFDDAHTAEHLLRDHFTLHINRDEFPKLFPAIVKLFDGYHSRIGAGVGYRETYRRKDVTKSWFIPPFVLRANLGELQRLLADANLHDSKGTMFSWEHLKDRIDLCCLFISGKDIHFTPPVPPTLVLPYFQDETRRLYLSATLTAKDAFLRTFGRIPEPIIAPATTAGECERLILLPRQNHQCRDKEIEVTKQAIADKKALILVPSNRAAEKWADVVGEQQGDDVTKQVELFKTARPPAKLLLVGRYDGVDLPGDTCRLMVIDELPSALGPLERYLWEKLGLQKVLRSTVASRVVQSFGRISRGMSDHGVVILTGESLVYWLLIPANKAALPKFLRQQLEVGLHISELAGDCDAIIGAASQCLNRDAGWLNFYQSSMEASAASADIPQGDEESLAIAQTEVNFGNALWSREYQKAAHTLDQELNKTFQMSGKAGAWHALWLGYCYELMGDNTQAEVMYRRARSATKNIPPLDVQPSSAEEQEVPAQVIEVARYLYNGTQVDKASIRNFASDLAVLDGSGTPKQTEEAIRKLGEYLGLESSRPDKEVGTGPDVLWDTIGGPSFNQELKTDKASTSNYSKRDVGQMYDHIQWVKENSESAIILSTFVGPVLAAATDANPGPEVMVIELGEYQAIAERLRVALEDICSRALSVTLRQIVFEVFRERNLLWPNLYDNMRKHVLRSIE